MTRPTLVLIHGWAADASVWDGVKPALSKDFDVVTPALPGHGQSTLAPMSLADLAEAIARSISGPAVWLGWSLGALLALQVALNNSDRVSKLLLVSASPSFQQRDDWLTAMPAETLADFIKQFQRQPEQTLRQFYGLQVQGDERAKSVLTRLKLMQVQPEAIRWGLEVLQQTDLRAALAQLNLPVKVLHGEQDQVIPVAAGRWMAQQLHSQVEVYPATGHAPMLSQPQAFIDWVRCSAA